MLAPLQFGPRPDPAGSKPFDTLIVFLKEILEKFKLIFISRQMTIKG